MTTRAWTARTSKQAFIWVLDFKENQKRVVSELGMVAYLGSRGE